MSDEQESLSSILSNDTAPAEKPDAVAVADTGEKTTPPVDESTTTAAERARDESGKFKAAEKAAETSAETPAKPDKPRADVAAIIDERRKRQAAEARLREFEQGQQRKPAPSVFDNEDEAISARVAEGTRPLKEAIYKLSVKTAKAVHGEAFDEASEAFMEAAERDPRLYQGLQASDDPGEYVFSLGIQLKELSDVDGDFVRYREKVRGEYTSRLADSDKAIAALTAEVAALKKAQTDLESIPRSLNAKPSGASPKAGDEGDEDIKSIARFGKSNTR